MRGGSQQAEVFKCSTRTLFTIQFTSFYAQIIQQTLWSNFEFLSCDLSFISILEWRSFWSIFWSVSLSAHYDDASAMECKREWSKKEKQRSTKMEQWKKNIPQSGNCVHIGLKLKRCLRDLRRRSKNSFAKE